MIIDLKKDICRSDPLMYEQLKLFFKLFNARLSLNIAIWVFLSLVFIEILILIPYL
jgi:hypothetical protein